MTDPYAETDDWPTAPATRPHGDAQPVSAPEPSGSTPEAAEAARACQPDERPGFEGLFIRLMARTAIDPTTGCWRLTGSPDHNGYGRSRWGGRQRLTHRLSHEAFIAPIPAGHVVDHVRERGCLYRDCWNPAHLEAVTTAENNARIPNWVREVCPKGHPMTDENTVTQKVPGGYTNRMCLECRRASGRESARRRYWASKEAQK